MAQHDYVISNGTGAAVRSDLNNALSAIVTQNSGSTEPTTTYAYQMWADTNAGVMKIRNGANSAWITLYQLDGEWTSIAFENGSAAAPSIYFKDSGTDTGFFSGGTDQVNIATAGTERVEWGTSEVVFNDAGNNYDFRVEGDTNANLLFVDASADAVGIGTGTPGSLLHLNVATAASDGTKGVRIANPAGTAAMFECGSSNDSYIGTLSGSDFSIRTNNTSRIYVTNGGNVGINTESPSDTSVFGKALDVNGTTGAACYVRTNGSATNFGLIGHYGTDFYVTNNSNGPIRFFANANERARIDSSGRLLVGTSSESAYSRAIFAGRSDGNAAGLVKLQSTNSAPASGDTLGNLLYGVTGATTTQAVAEIYAARDGGTWTNNSSMPGRLVFATTADGASSSTERIRITNGGELTNKTSNIGSTTGSGFTLGPTNSGYFVISRTASAAIFINRITNDGDLVQFYQDDTLEGSISVSGTTVSYNGAHLSRWSQLPSGVERTEILRGSVLSNIDEMCEWSDEENEQLNRMKVSDVEGDKNVSGVFQSWDDDDDTYTNDFYCAMTGDFIIRIGAGVTVERGDLLMSAGDGTAKPQNDDIIRSKTIAKVTSTNVSCTYDDGSYCVPCVVMAC